MFKRGTTFYFDNLTSVGFDDDHFYLVSDKIYKFGLRDI